MVGPCTRLGLQEQSTNLTSPSARRIAAQLLRYIETTWGTQEKLAATNALLEYVAHAPSFPAELLVQLYYARGYACLYRSEEQQAFEDFRRTLELTDSNDYTFRGSIYFDLKEYQLALADCDRFIEGNPNNYWACFQRGQTYLWIRDIRQARADFTKSWELDSTIVWNGWMTEWARMCQERPDSGMAERLNTIAAPDPQDYCAYVCRGVAQWLRGRFEEALAEIERAIALKAKMWGGMPTFGKGWLVPPWANTRKPWYR